MTEGKKEKLLQFHRQNIAETAERLFTQKGVRQTTMDEIAKEADYSKSTVYVYFKSKEEIFHYILYGYMCRLREIILDCTGAEAPFEACYYRLCRELVQLQEQCPLYFPGLLGNISVDENDMKKQEVLKKIYDEGEVINDAMQLFFQKGIKEGCIRKDIAVLPAVFTLWASLGSLITTSHEKEAYLLKRMGMKKTEFLEFGFGLLLDALKKKGESVQ